MSQELGQEGEEEQQHLGVGQVHDQAAPEPARLRVVTRGAGVGVPGAAERAVGEPGQVEGAEDLQCCQHAGMMSHDSTQAGRDRDRVNQDTDRDAESGPGRCRPAAADAVATM